MVNTALQSSVIINLVLTVVIKAPMKLSFNMMGALQLLTFIPSLNIVLPTNLGVCLATINEIANMNLVPESWTNYMLNTLGINTLQNDGQSALNNPSKYMKQLTSILIVFGCACIAVLLIIMLYYIARKYPK